MEDGKGEELSSLEKRRMSGFMIRTQSHLIDLPKEKT